MFAKTPAPRAARAGALSHSRAAICVTHGGFCHLSIGGRARARRVTSYANQQFFDGSRWQWTVPPLRADNALVNGPLPLMTLWRKERGLDAESDLWLATPHGFDEALPKGHEDWAFWLQLTERLPLDSVPRLMRTLFADLLDQKPGITEAVVMDVSVSQHLHPTRPEPHLWSGMILQAKGDLAGAAAAYNASAALAAPYDWQGSYRFWRALLLLGDGAAAAREEAALRRRTDAYGDVLPAASE
ncbi:hypothetical protein EMIHUDRAFT_219808 [Emiliania huxleyi CCMP1516]|uniref:Uncharacterized protein n=2 Tax=Emiliania huxleyi TaxID=2903 RepID=A0A0D3I3B7_EMIH1|nr:hypothetical protein EMIHUDRAFT_219808 [Emiliania huxleyi CCMP1516]EOD05752.1 hypothetical protein EMIHUDRAFT_219808 [Emiliania huxleyi CCMP1516]|eukprot:XP_005758181.1 hypothetical protein EMIHUDRAFT_219808 [Emiliania huxleyi CCMP1516]